MSESVRAHAGKPLGVPEFAWRQEIRHPFGDFSKFGETFSRAFSCFFQNSGEEFVATNFFSNLSQM